MALAGLQSVIASLLNEWDQTGLATLATASLPQALDEPNWMRLVRDLVKKGSLHLSLVDDAGKICSTEHHGLLTLYGSPPSVMVIVNDPNQTSVLSQVEVTSPGDAALVPEPVSSEEPVESTTSRDVVIQPFR